MTSKRTVAPPSPPVTVPRRLDLVFLGTSSATSFVRGHTAATLLRWGDQQILVDCGRNAQQHLRATGIVAADLHAVVLTHWHPDHTAGLPPLLASGARKGRRTTPLRIYAPPPPPGVTQALALAAARAGVDVELVIMQPGHGIALDGATLTAIGTRHNITSLGWDFHESGPDARHIVISGDTRPEQAIFDAARDADLLVHEATFPARNATWADKLGHSTAPAVGTRATAAGVGALAIVHISGRVSRQDVIDEVSAGYPDVKVPADLEILEVLPIAPAIRRAARGTTGWAQILHAQFVKPRVATDLDAPDGLAS